MAVELRVAHWNVWYRQDVRALPGFLRALEADVLCLCELTTDHGAQVVPDGAAYLADQLGMHVERIRLPLTPGGTESMVNAVLTRLPVLGSRRVTVNEPDGSGGYQDEYRGYVEVTLDVRGGPLAVGVTHLSYAHRFEDSDRKVAEARRLLAAVPAQRAILCGDFNTAPGSAVHAVLTERLAPTGPAVPTWTTKPFSYGGFEEDQLRWPLDGILATPDLTATSYRAVETSLSDHLPLLASLEV